MRTLAIIAIGLTVLGVGFALHKWLYWPRQISTLTGLFIVVWFIVAATNMWIGVAQAGYSVLEELPIFLIIFGLPAIAALLLRYRVG